MYIQAWVSTFSLTTYTRERLTSLKHHTICGYSRVLIELIRTDRMLRWVTVLDGHDGHML